MPSTAETSSPDGQLEHVFRNEAEGLVTRLRGAVGALNGAGHDDALQDARRSAHSLKSAASAVGDRAVVKLAHRMEDLMDRLQAPVGETAQEAFSVLQAAIDVLNELLDTRQDPRRLDDAVTSICSQIETFLGAQRPEPPQEPEHPVADSLLDSDEYRGGIVQDKSTPQILRRAMDAIARRQGKQIDLVVKGGDVEQRTRVWEDLAVVLLHLLKNAADHGIETPQERRRKNKPPAGTITLDASLEQRNIVLRIADDGRGLDTQRIRQKAVERGLLTKTDANRLSDSQVHLLIFELGLSTTDCVTDISGRGIGLDVVRETLRQLGGAIEVESVEDQGTTFTIRIPRRT